MSITLSNRLKTIASFVEPGSRVIDVGTDHGYVPVWLAENNICTDIFASDINKGPLASAVRTAEGAGVAERITILLGAGLEKCPPDAVDTVIIAGMGGETICKILADAPWSQNKMLVLQPQTCISELRLWLNDNGFAVSDAALSKDNGKLYAVWKLRAGEKRELSLIDGYIDPCIIKNRDPLLGEYIDELINKFTRRLGGLKLSAEPHEEELSFVTALLGDLIKLKESI